MIRKPGGGWTPRLALLRLAVVEKDLAGLLAVGAGQHLLAFDARWHLLRHFLHGVLGAEPFLELLPCFQEDDTLRRASIDTS